LLKEPRIVVDNIPITLIMALRGALECNRLIASVDLTQTGKMTLGTVICRPTAASRTPLWLASGLEVFDSGCWQYGVFQGSFQPKAFAGEPSTRKRRPHMSRKHILRDGLSLCSRRLPLCAWLGQELQQSLVDLLRVCPSDVVRAIFDDNQLSAVD